VTRCMCFSLSVPSIDSHFCRAFWAISFDLLSSGHTPRSTCGSSSQYLSLAESSSRHVAFMVSRAWVTRALSAAESGAKRSCKVVEVAALKVSNNTFQCPRASSEPRRPRQMHSFTPEVSPTSLAKSLYLAASLMSWHQMWS